MTTLTTAERESLRTFLSNLRQASFLLEWRLEISEEKYDPEFEPRRMSMERLERRVLNLVQQHGDDFRLLLRLVEAAGVEEGEDDHD
jgi:hypothetical protein